MAAINPLDYRSTLAGFSGELLVVPARLSKVSGDLAPFLAPEDHARLSRLTRPEVRRTFEVSRGLLRVMLGGYLSSAPAEVPLQITERGKPYLAESSLRFNVTHSGDYVGFAFCHDREVGIDYEKHETQRPLIELAARFFAPPERDALQALPEAQHLGAFYDCWTRKEAYLKALGLGVTAGLDQVVVTITGQPRVLNGLDHNREWQLIDAPPAAGYSGTIAVEAVGQTASTLVSY